jgi:hypothetical protein
MGIWSFYTNTQMDNKQLVPYTEAVNNMSTITKELNKMYHERIESTRESTAKTAAPVKAVAALPPVTTMPSLKVQSSLPVTTVSARGASPVTKQRR